MPLNLENEDANVNSTDLKKKPTKKTKEMLEENTRQIEELTASQSELDSELAALEKEEQALGEKSALKMKVSHKKFGDGVITKQDGKYIEVKFGKVVKKFVLPGAIAEKHLKVSDEKILEFYNKCDDIHKQILKVQMQLRSTDFAIERQADNIEKLNQKA